MYICLVGINYQTAPVEVREKIAIGAKSLPTYLEKLRTYVRHGVILSTCNRTEIYSSGADAKILEKSCLGYIQNHLNVDIGQLSSYVYTKTDKGLVEHIYRVACGLDSMVIGEYEVLGQVKQALDTAEKAGMVDLALRHILQSAVSTGRRARDETEISRYALSISSIAVNRAVDIIMNVDDVKMLVIGAGDMGKQAVKVAISRGLKDIVVVSRTEERANGLTDCLGGRPANADKLKEELIDRNIVITCAASPHHLLHHENINEIMMRRPDKPMIIYDIAVPRNVDPEVKRIKNVYLYDIDDLNDAINVNRAQREHEQSAVESVIIQEVSILMNWWKSYRVRPAVKSLIGKADKIRLNQLNKSFKKLNGISDEEKNTVDLLTKSIVDKILRDPILYLKDNDNSKDTMDKTEIVKEIFKLDT